MRNDCDELFKEEVKSYLDFCTKKIQELNDTFYSLNDAVDKMISDSGYSFDKSIVYKKKLSNKSSSIMSTLFSCLDEIEGISSNLLIILVYIGCRNKKFHTSIEDEEEFKQICEDDTLVMKEAVDIKKTFDILLEKIDDFVDDYGRGSNSK